MIIEGELYSSKNSRQIFRTKDGRTFIAKSDVAKKQEKTLCQIMAYRRREWDKMTEGKTYPLRISFKIYRKTHRHFDFCNIIQGFQDCMQMAGWIPDDDADHLIPVFEPYEVDKNNPRVEIKIL